jgi:hypothetical protein
VGFTYDVFGDRDKIYGSYGRTYLPVASNTAFRAASPAIDISEFWLPAGGATTFGALNPVTGFRSLARRSDHPRRQPGGLPGQVGSGPIAPVGSYGRQVRNNGRSPIRTRSPRIT